MVSKQLPYAALIKQLSTEIQKRADAALQESDLTMTQMYFLGALSHLPEGTATLKELERYFRVAQSTAAGVAARMEKKGLIESLPSESDRRVKRVRITASGAETRRRASAPMERGGTPTPSALDDAEQETRIALRRKVHGALRREEESCPCP